MKANAQYLKTSIQTKINFQNSFSLLLNNCNLTPGKLYIQLI